MVALVHNDIAFVRSLSSNNLVGESTCMCAIRLMSYLAPGRCLSSTTAENGEHRVTDSRYGTAASPVLHRGW